MKATVIIQRTTPPSRPSLPGLALPKICSNCPYSAKHPGCSSLPPPCGPHRHRRWTTVSFSRWRSRVRCPQEHTCPLDPTSPTAPKLSRCSLQPDLGSRDPNWEASRPQRLLGSRITLLHKKGRASGRGHPQRQPEVKRDLLPP